MRFFSDNSELILTKYQVEKKAWFEDIWPHRLSIISCTRHTVALPTAYLLYHIWTRTIALYPAVGGQCTYYNDYKCPVVIDSALYLAAQDLFTSIEECAKESNNKLIL